MAIATTAGGSGVYELGASTGDVTLFTTPNVANAIFIVTLIESTSGTAAAVGNKAKVIVGPNTAYKIYDNVGKDGAISWNWIQMIIS
jgi:hypothetical protein